MMKEMRDNSITLAAAQKLPAEKTEGKIVRGILRQDVRPNSAMNMRSSSSV